MEEDQGDSHSVGAAAANYAIGEAGGVSVLSNEGQQEQEGLEEYMHNMNTAGNAADDGDGGGGIAGTAGDGDEDADDEEDDEDAESLKKIRLDTYAKAKGLVTLTSRAAKRVRTNQSPIWNYMYCVRINAGKKSQLEELDSDASSVILKDSDDVYCCVLCYKDATKSLANCLKKSQKNGGTGNLLKHIKQNHPQVAAVFKETAWNSGVSTSKKRAGTDLSTLASKKSKAGDGSVVSSIAPASVVPGDSEMAVKKPCPSIAFRNQILENGAEAVVKKYQTKVFQFANNNNIAIRAVTDHKNCPEFRDLIDFVVKHASTLKAAKGYHLGKYGYSTIMFDSFTEMIAAVKMYVEETRDWYLKYCKKPIRFVVVSFDGWDSTNKDALGVTVSLCNPVREMNLVVPIGLAALDDKTSQGTAMTTFDLLAAAGIKPEDIYKVVNDTTNSALKTGRILTENTHQGTCAMHAVQLALEHGTGRKTRSRGGNVTDRFVDAESIRKRSLAAAGYLMEKKSKGRFIKYKKEMAKVGREVIRIAMPNSTRAGGILLHYESMLRSKWNLDRYWFEDSDANHTLSESDWSVIAQLASVIYPNGACIKAVQTDRPGNLAYTHALIFRTFCFYAVRNEFWVAQTSRKANKKEETKWNGNAKWPRRNYMGEPEAVDGDELPSTNSLIGMVKRKKSDLSPVSQTLIARLCKELKTYGAVPSADRLLAMACNPFTATVLMTELETLCDILTEESKDDDTKKYAVDHKQLAMDALEEAIRDICSELIGESSSQPADITGLSGGGIKAKRRQKILAAQSASNAMEADPVKRQVKAFFEQNFDPVQALRSQETVAEDVIKKIGNNLYSWLEHWEIIAKHFDSYHYWHNVGKKEFPLIYPIAMLIHSLPDSNGHQERTFSSATWMDEKLKQKQSDMTFQMKVLLYRNKDFLDIYRDHVEEDRLAAASLRTKRLLELSASLKKEDEIGEDLEQMLDYCDSELEEES